jgi:hypothetical protein
MQRRRSGSCPPGSPVTSCIVHSPRSAVRESTPPAPVVAVLAPQASRKTRWKRRRSARRAPCRASPPRARRRGRCRTIRRVDAADVDPPGERDASVDDENLAVVAVVDLPALRRRLQRIHRVELADRDSPGAQAFEEFFRRLHRADAVVQDVHRHALLAFAERSSASRSPGPRPEDVGLEVDVVAARPMASNRRASSPGRRRAGAPCRYERPVEHA